MGRKVSERERLVRFAISAPKEQLAEAMEILSSALKERFGGRPKASAAPVAGKRSLQKRGMDASIANTEGEEASAIAATKG